MISLFYAISKDVAKHFENRDHLNIIYIHIMVLMQSHMMVQVLISNIMYVNKEDHDNDNDVDVDNEYISDTDQVEGEKNGSM